MHEKNLLKEIGTIKVPVALFSVAVLVSMATATLGKLLWLTGQYFVYLMVSGV